MQIKHFIIWLFFVFSTLSPEKKDHSLNEALIQIDKAFVLGKFNYKTDTNFIKVDPKYSSKEIYLNMEVYEAFIEMYDHAEKDGISLKIISGTRNFSEQKAIWERKWVKYTYLEPKERAEKILEYSSMPSTSRHHWGTDLDLNSLNNSYFNGGKGKSEYEWLKANANNFGFYQVYTEKSIGRTGYNLEKWHWSFLPLASKYLDFYNKNIEYSDIRGFKGDTLASEMKMIHNYVNGLSKKVKGYKSE
ncbi:M15 family metallopeptidase [Winogradskyella alexanderae]|uniref:M15 family metallopeptidase n=1 Tax=Winogradskyella alexanderae TaxID=2877123 RepID=A0ABS7XQM3_9FLAO|nr:M15 family metallopeptidase [Winogradskyella alexanderae]MCA0131819.1 M15 family metallopeptidase [Winogradskyella alexanderae]